MIFNSSKKDRPNIEIRINESCLEKVKTQKFLGVLFDEKMSWKDHINSVISKLNSCLGATRRARPFLDVSSLFTIYHSLMQSRANYCCSAWAAWEPRGNKIILQRLQAVCNKFFRLIFDLNHTESVRHLLKSHNTLNIFQHYDFQVAKVCIKQFMVNCQYL